MTALEYIKSRINRLYTTNPNIHVNVSITHPRVVVRNDPAVIKAVYPHVFRIEEHSTGVTKVHTVQYTDVLTRQFEIIEL